MKRVKGGKRRKKRRQKGTHTPYNHAMVRKMGILWLEMEAK